MFLTFIFAGSGSKRRQ